MQSVDVEVNVCSRCRCSKLVSLVSLIAVLGCGGGSGDQFPTANVTGKVTLDGQPVTGGEVLFSPLAANGEKSAGKSGVGKVAADGSFAVSTYGNGDGAVVGKHRVAFFPPSSAETPAGPEGGHAGTPSSPYAGMTPKQVEVTVSKGANKIDIELVKPAATSN
jgi:hypothetical protein